MLKFTLGVEETRDYLEHRDPEAASPTTIDAFEGRWFGARSEPRTKIILRNLKARFDAYPHALKTLVAWTGMDPQVRTLICHWHTQLTDPTYRAFAGQYLPDRLMSATPYVTLDGVVSWVTTTYPGDWQPTTVRQMASKLMSTAFQSGLLDSTTEQRRIVVPRVPEEAFTYLMYLLRGIEFEGTLLDNPYLRSVGLEGLLIEDRLRQNQDVAFRRQGDLIDFDWAQPDLETWGAARA